MRENRPHGSEGGEVLAFPTPILFSFDDFFHIMLISSAIAMGLNFFVLDFNGKIEGN